MAEIGEPAEKPIQVPAPWRWAPAPREPEVPPAPPAPAEPRREEEVPA